MGYYDDSKAYKIRIPHTHTVLKMSNVIFDKSNHIEHITIHLTDEDKLPSLCINDAPISSSIQDSPGPSLKWTNNTELPMQPAPKPERPEEAKEEAEAEKERQMKKRANQRKK